MNTSFSAGFLEKPHTADVELEVWAPDPGTLLAKAAEGMYSLMSVVPDDGCLEERGLQLNAPDLEGLLVVYLDELLHILDTENLVCHPMALEVADVHLNGRLVCAGVASRTREIKAVTWHNLAVRQEAGLLRVAIVFDV
jgi:SHS2 domain-containing protein